MNNAGQAWTLRGGSFNNNQDNARCANRNRNNPNNNFNNNGFRVVVRAFFCQIKAGNLRRGNLARRGELRKEAKPCPGRCDEQRANNNRPASCQG